MRQTRATSAPEQGATKNKETIITSMSEGSLLACEQEAAKSGRQRYLRGLRVITPTGVQKEQMGPNSGHQVMVNTFQKSTYVPPHKHPNKWEYFSMEEIGKGEVKVIFFSDDGKVTKVETLSPGKDSYLTIPEGVYHSVVAKKDGSQLEEIKPGKFDAATDKVSPDWAPAEDSPSRFEFHRWLDICKPGDEARHFQTILSTHDSQTLLEIRAKLSEALQKQEMQDQVIKQNQAVLINLQLEKAFRETDLIDEISSKISLAEAPSPEPSTCAIGYWPFWSGPKPSSTSKEANVGSDRAQITVNIANLTIFGVCPPSSRMRDDAEPRVQLVSSDTPDPETAQCSFLGF